MRSRSPAQATDGAETDAGWTFDGFRVTSGTENSDTMPTTMWSSTAQYWGYDKNLQVGPYNFGFLDNPLLGDWVEHLPYQDGLLINYWDTSQSNNQVSTPSRTGPAPAGRRPSHGDDPRGWRRMAQPDADV